MTYISSDLCYFFNHQVLKNAEGTLVVHRRPNESNKVQRKASEYIPCEFCHVFVHEKILWQHIKSCDLGPGLEDTEANYVRNSRVIMSPFIHIEEKERSDIVDGVINKMNETTKNPGLKEVCIEDTLIREFGLCLLDRMGTPEEQRRKDEDNVRTKLRSTARLLGKLNGKKLRPQAMDNYITGGEFMNVVMSVNELSREAGSPNLALTLGHYIKQICLLKGSLAIQTANPRKRQEANDFKELYAAHWNSKVAAIAHRRLRLKSMNKTQDIPSTEDLVNLKNYLVNAIQRGIEGSQIQVYDQYLCFAQLVLAQIVLFNKRRIAEVDELKVWDFEHRMNGRDCEHNSEIEDSLGASERALAKR